MFSKKMITLLVLVAVLAAGSALAGDNFKVYGKFNVSADMMNNSEDSQMTLASNSSRFGLRGSEELNENFTFIWQFESLIDIADGPGTPLATRNSFLGLKGNWGMFLYGKHDTPFKNISRKVELFGEQFGDSRYALGAVGEGWDRRLTDVMVYGTPDLSGFKAMLAYRHDQADLGAEEAATAVSANASYANSGLWVGVGIETLSTGNYYDPVTKADADYECDGSLGLRFAAKYEGDNFKVVGLYQALTYKAFAGDDTKASTFGGGAAYGATDQWWIKAQVYVTDPNTDDAEEGPGKDNESTLMAFGVDYKYTKNWTWYVNYAAMGNADNAALGMEGGLRGSGIAPSAAGETASAFSTGIIATF